MKLSFLMILDPVLRTVARIDEDQGLSHVNVVEGPDQGKRVVQRRARAIGQNHVIGNEVNENEVVLKKDPAIQEVITQKMADHYVKKHLSIKE